VVSAPTTRRNFVAAATESVSFAVANQLTAVAVVLPFICVAFGGSAFAAALIFPTYTAANLLGVILAPRVLGLRSVSRSLALILILIWPGFALWRHSLYEQRRNGSGGDDDDDDGDD